MCKKHYVAAVKILLALSLANTMYAMETEPSRTDAMKNAVVIDNMETLPIPVRRIVEAIVIDDSNEVCLLIKEKNIFVNEVFELGNSVLTPLLLAAMKNAVKTGDVLLNLNAQIEPKLDSTASAVAVAAMNDSVEFLKLLQVKKINLDKSDDRKKTPLHCAIVFDAVNAVNYLLEADADRQSIEVKGAADMRLPILHFAAAQGAVRVVRLLIEKYKYSVNYKVNVAMNFNITPNDLAVMAGHWNVCELLKTKGANHLSHHAHMQSILMLTKNN